MADFTLPILTSLYTDILNLLKARDVDAITLCVSAPTTPPTGAFKYVRADNKFQEWNGASWDDKVLAIAGGGTGGATAAAARTALGLGTIATQAANSVAITGGTISGVSLDASGFTTGIVALARGGTGASLSLGASGTFLRSTGSAVEFSAVGTSLTALNATNLTIGTVPLARLSGITVTEMASANVSQFTNDAGYVSAATASLPIGAMVGYGGTSAPTSWLLCDGAAVSRTTYAALFAIIGTNFGVGDGSTTFNVPDSRGRSILGTSVTYPIGTTLGSVLHSHAPGTLVNDTAPSHTHTMSGTSGPGSSHTHGSFTGSSGSSGSHTHGGNTGSAAPPNHGHAFTSDSTDVGVSSAYIDEGDGNFGQTLAVTGLSAASHSHTGSTTGVDTDQSHAHTISSDGSHTHDGGTYFVGTEAAHTHGGGSFAAGASGAHAHILSGATATGSHAVLAATMIIKYQ
jgi:microcystin-dependent protein